MGLWVKVIYIISTNLSRGRGVVSVHMNNSPQTDQNTHTPVTLTISTGCIKGEIKSLLLGDQRVSLAGVLYFRTLYCGL